MNIRPAEGNDIPELVQMYRSLLVIAYPQRRIAPTEVLYGLVVQWFKNKDTITIVYNDDGLVGFTLMNFNNAGGSTETVIDAEISYVKPQYRKSRAAYLLYKEGLKYAVHMGMGVMSTSNPDSAPIMKKRYNAELTFSHFEIPADYIQNLKK